MRKGKSVIGQPLLSYNDGAKVGSVKDLLIGGNNDRLVALLVEEGGLLSSPRAVPLEYVTSFGKDAVVITDLRGIIAADNYPEAAEILSRNDKLLGKKVFTESGEDHGKIDDVFFNDADGRVLGYEVSGGLIENVQKGMSYLPLEDIVNIGPDIVMIRYEAGGALDSQVGGAQGALQTAQQKLGGAADPTGGQQGQPQSQPQQDPQQAVVGMHARSTVEADNGSIIVATGQRITQQHVQEAQAQGKLEPLLASGGVVQPSDAPQQAGAKLEEVGQNVSAAAGQATDQAGDLWTAFTNKISQLTDASGKRIDEERTKQRLAAIQDAVGRPVSKVILDRQDNVVLNLGDIITHESVQRAYDAGMLDTLLENVYKGDVEFSKDEMKAQSDAQATVEKASGDAPMIDHMEQRIDQLKQERQEIMSQPANGQPAPDQDGRQDRQARQEPQGGQSTAPTMAAGGRQEGEVSDLSTEDHVQASLPNDQFHRAGQSPEQPSA